MHEVISKMKLPIRVAKVEMTSLFMQDYVDKRAMQEVEKSILGFGWRSMKAGILADKAKVDQMYQLNDAAVYVQVKGSNLASRLDKRTNKCYPTWSWKIFEGAKLPMSFYGREGNYLALAGFEISQEPLKVKVADWTKKLLDDKWYHKFCEHSDPMVGLIPAKKVAHFFKKKSPKTHNISTTRNAIKNGNSYLSKYFEKQYAERLLNEELERQLKQC